MKKSILFLWILFLTSCAQEGKVTVQQSTVFDLETYFEKEIKYLLANQKSVTKRVQLNDKEETKTITDLNFEKELAIFSKSNINKIAWIEEYQVDSIFENSQLRELHYSTTNEKLKTKMLSVFYAGTNVSEIKIHNKTNTALADAEQQLHYQVGKGYSIRNLQDVSFSEPQNLVVEVSY